MKFSKLFLIGVSSLGLLFLGACSSGNQAANDAPSSATTKAEAKSPESHSEASQGGQVVESGPYHMEFVPEKEAQGTHLDFYLKKGEAHTPVSDAKVMAQIQLPDGTQKSLDLKYDAGGKHYTALFADKAAGEYKVAMLSEISGEKVNGRFNFKQ